MIQRIKNYLMDHNIQGLYEKDSLTANERVTLNNMLRAWKRDNGYRWSDK